MSAEILVAGLNALYLVPMAVISVVGTAAMVKLALTFVQREPRTTLELSLTVEDA